MNKIDIRAIQNGITSEDFIEAKKCPHLLYDKNYGAALWHKCFCNFTPKDRGMPQSCNLVWRGECIQNTGTPPESRYGREPEKVKSLAQYLDEYIEHEVDLDNIESADMYAYNSWRQFFEQALDAYQSTENVVIKIERNV